MTKSVLLSENRTQLQNMSQLVESAVDITGTWNEKVQIQIRTDQKVIWVNVNGICVLRVCRIGQLEVEQ